MLKKGTAMPSEGSAVTMCLPPCRKPLARAALHSFRAVRALLSKQDGSQATLSHCEKASSCLRESLELGSPPKGTIDKVSWAGEARGGREPPALAGGAPDPRGGAL